MKKFIFILCAAFLTFALVLGFITYNKTTQALLSVNIEALTNNENEETSNNEGSNNKGDGSKFYYEHLQGKPKTCILFRNVSLNGEISFSSEKQTGTLGYNAEVAGNVKSIVFNSEESVTNSDFNKILDTTFRVIPLATNDECLISNIDRLEIVDGKFYIMDHMSQSVYVFNPDGSYAGKIHKHGRGPGEYTNYLPLGILFII